MNQDKDLQEKIRTALSKMDTSNDNHWTIDGHPRIETVKMFSGNASLTREMISQAAPDFNRSNTTLPEQKVETKQTETTATNQPTATREVSAPTVGTPDSGKNADGAPTGVIAPVIPTQAPVGERATAKPNQKAHVLITETVPPQTADGPARIPQDSVVIHPEVVGKVISENSNSGDDQKELDSVNQELNELRQYKTELDKHYNGLLAKQGELEGRILAGKKSNDSDAKSMKAFFKSQQELRASRMGKLKEVTDAIKSKF